jgi:acyl carrier protein
MNNEIFNRLNKFIFEQGFGYKYSFPLSFRKKELTRETSIENDLRITGDDADEFIIAFGKEFNVDVSKFPIGDYFGDEGDPILPAILGKERKLKKLTIGQLEKAVVAGHLDENVINS